MVGGVAWMVNGNMACGVIGEDLMIRLDRDEARAGTSEEHPHQADLECSLGRHPQSGAPVMSYVNKNGGMVLIKDWKKQLEPRRARAQTDPRVLAAFPDGDQ